MAHISLIRNMSADELLTEIPHLLVQARLAPDTISVLQEAIELLFQKAYQKGYSDGFMRITP